MGKFASFVFGGVVGATLGLLFAPRTGEESRAVVAEKVDEYWGKGQTLYTESRTKIQQGITDFQPTINQKTDEMRDKIDSARTLIAEQVAKNAAAARDVINDKMPVVVDKVSTASEAVRGQIDSVTSKLKSGVEASGTDIASAIATESAPVPEKIVPEQAAEPVDNVVVGTQAGVDPAAGVAK